MSERKRAETIDSTGNWNSNLVLIQVWFKYWSVERRLFVIICRVTQAHGLIGRFQNHVSTVGP